MVERYGTDLHPHYLDVCREMMTQEAAKAGYGLDRFWGFYSGHSMNQTHYAARLNRSAGAV
jgi:hypothetical protein